ncbi:MAG: hypothetical protein Q9185_002452 [Variospora sp. 1 TL-2023]
MDPVSITAGFLGVLDVALRATSALTKYARDTKTASSDRKALAEETLFLSKLLQRLRDRAQTARHDDTWLADHKEIVGYFEAAYDDLAVTLKLDGVTGRIEERTRLRAAYTKAKWSFSKAEVYSLLERVTRLQQYANVLLADDQHTLLERIDQKQQEGNLIGESIQSLADLMSSPSAGPENAKLRPELAVPSTNVSNPSNLFRSSREGLGGMVPHRSNIYAMERPRAIATLVLGNTSIIINKLRQDRPEEVKSRIGITFVYFRYNETDQTIDNILSSLLKQLLQDSDEIPSDLISIFERHRDRNTSPTIDEISQALSTVIDTQKEVFCIIDALDECNDDLRWALIENLETLGPKLRVLITSRYLDSIAEELEDYQRFEIRANKADIELFIDYQVRRNRNLRKIVEKSPSLRDDIKQGVFKTAERMQAAANPYDSFLLARLHVESLASAACLSIKHVRNKLRTLPTTLKGTYDNALERIENQEPEHRRVAFKTMAWVCYAFRALSLKELQHALAVEPGDTMLDEDLVMDGQSITSLCAGLIVVDQRTNMVNLVHYSTKSYFDDIRHIQFPEFHANITLICATYLTLDALQGAKIWEIVQDYPLACYAAQFMGDHARNSPEESLGPSILEMICNLLSHPDKRKPLLSLLDGLDLIQAGFYSKGRPMTRTSTAAVIDASAETEMPTFFDSVLEMESTDSLSTTSSRLTTESDASTLMGDRAEDEEVWETKIKTSRIPEVTALHLAASMGLAKIASLLLKETTNIDAVDETGKTALALALERGFEKAVEFLINSGACVDLRHEHGRGVLLLITERGWFNAGDIIVEKARLTADKELLGRAQARVRLLLAVYGNDTGESSRVGASAELQLPDTDRDVAAAALFLAVERESAPMVRTLLAVGVDVNSKDDLGQTALHRATRRNDDQMVRLLIKSGADLEGKDDDHRTPWSANLRCSNPAILQILLDAGADPSTCEQQGLSELYTAAKDGDTGIIKYMLECGTNPSIPTIYGWAPLHWAASYGHIDCVKLLLGAGAEPNPISDQKVTPLDLATQADQSTVVELLLKVGAKMYQDIKLPTEQKSDNRVSTARCDSDKTPDRESASTAVLVEGKVDGVAEKLRLVYDKPLARTLLKPAAVGRFVYPSGTTGAGNDIFKVSQFLETSSATIHVRRAETRLEMWEYSNYDGHFEVDDALYEVTKIKNDYQEFELSGRGQDPFPGTLTMHKDWTGGWKVRQDIEGRSKGYLLRTTPEWSRNKEEDSRWMIENGTLQARSGWDDATPWISMETMIDRQMLDLIVTCWVVKLWSETAAFQRS